MTRARGVRSALMVGLAATIGLGAGVTGAQTGPSKTWDQERVASLAADLASAVQDVKTAFRRKRSGTRKDMRTTGFHQLQRDLRAIRRETRELANELKRGQGRDETFPIYRRIQASRGRAANALRRLMVGGSALESIESARDILKQIEPFYGPV